MLKCLKPLKVCILSKAYLSSNMKKVSTSMNLKKSDQKILQLMQKNNKITIKELMAILDMLF